MQSISVLHVDDDAAMSDLTVTYLERVDERLDVQTAIGAEAGLDVLSDEHIDCVVSDYDMPEMDGLAFLEAVREDHPDLPFILFTGKGSEDIASDAISAGVTDYLQKQSGSEQYELLANRIENAVSQYRAERLATQHARILDEVLKTTRSVIEANDPGAVLQAACESLAEGDPYCFAIGIEPDPDSPELNPTCWAGEDRGFLDVVREVGVRKDDEPTGRGPGGRAARTGEVQVLQDLAEDPAFEPWREHAESRGFESLAAVPLQYDDRLWGVLGVFADRPYAFDEMERTALSDLGTIIAHAASAAELETTL